MSHSVPIVRFSDLVKHFDPAQLMTLWSDPKTDKSFMRAVAENRVITITLHNVGTRKDFGIVGFDPKPSATWVVFAKPLSAATGTKVIGVKYELLEEPPVKDPVSLSSSQPSRKVGPATPKPDKAVFERTNTDKKVIACPAPKPPQKFKVAISVTTKSQVEKEIEAENAKEARALALEEMKKEPVDLASAAITRRVISAKKLAHER